MCLASPVFPSAGYKRLPEGGEGTSKTPCWINQYTLMGEHTAHILELLRTFFFLSLVVQQQKLRKTISLLATESLVQRVHLTNVC